MYSVQNDGELEEQLKLLLHQQLFSANSKTPSKVCARYCTPMEFDDFFILYETLMKSAHHGILAAEGISHHMIFEVENTVLEYTGFNYKLCDLVQAVSKSIVKIGEDSVELFCVEQHINSKPKVPTPFRPNRVVIQQRWNFKYKNAFRYSLVQFSTGRTKADAAQSTPKYTWYLETIPNAKYFKNLELLAQVKNFQEKIKDLLGSRFPP